MKVSIIATGFQNKNEMDSTFNKKADSTIKPFVSGRIKNGVREQVVLNTGKTDNRTAANNASTAKEEEKAEKNDDSPISDDDFNEILEILSKNRNQSQTTSQNDPFPKRY